MNKRKIFGYLLLLTVLFAIDSQANADKTEMEILGWVEQARVIDTDMMIKAKLDTGAETSSLDARIIKKFRKDGKRWVRFALIDRESGEEQMLVRERVRTVSIVQHDGSSQTRPVVNVKICIAGRTLDTEVSLVDRREFIYPLLLGRSVLHTFALIDPGSTFLSEPQCGPDESDS